MIRRFLPCEFSFPGDYTWCLDTEARTAYAVYPDGSVKPPTANEPFERIVEGADEAVASGVWREIDEHGNTVH